MSVVDLNIFRAAKTSDVKPIKTPVGLHKGAPARESLIFEGRHDEVIDAVLAWLADADQYGPVELIADSETVMLNRKGSVDFIQTRRHSGPFEWSKRLSRKEAMWWELDEDAGICHAGVLLAIVSEHRDALTELVRDGIGPDSWRNNAFVVAMDGDKDAYYDRRRSLEPLRKDAAQIAR